MRAIRGHQRGHGRRRACNGSRAFAKKKYGNFFSMPFCSKSITEILAILNGQSMRREIFISFKPVR